jgi:hypothetical protein
MGLWHLSEALLLSWLSLTIYLRRSIFFFGYFSWNSQIDLPIPFEFAADCRQQLIGGFGPAFQDENLSRILIQLHPVTSQLYPQWSLDLCTLVCLTFHGRFEVRPSMPSHLSVLFFYGGRPIRGQPAARKGWNLGREVPRCGFDFGKSSPGSCSWDWWGAEKAGGGDVPPFFHQARGRLETGWYFCLDITQMSPIVWTFDPIHASSSQWPSDCLPHLGLTEPSIVGVWN